MTRRPWLARKWKICGLLFLATTLNYLDHQTLSILAPILREDMHLNNERLGWLARFSIGHICGGRSACWG
jgi:hypothetical protein